MIPEIAKPIAINKIIDAFMEEASDFRSTYGDCIWFLHDDCGMSYENAEKMLGEVTNAINEHYSAIEGLMRDGMSENDAVKQIGRAKAFVVDVQKYL